MTAYLFSIVVALCVGMGIGVCLCLYALYALGFFDGMDLDEIVSRMWKK